MDYDVLNSLLSHGASVNDSDMAGLNPIILTVKQNKFALLKYFV